MVKADLAQNLENEFQKIQINQKEINLKELEIDWTRDIVYNIF